MSTPSLLFLKNFFKVSCNSAIQRSASPLFFQIVVFRNAFVEFGIDFYPSCV